MLTALMLGARNALCGLRMVPLLGVTGAKRLLAAQWTIDESTAMALAREDHADERAARTAFWATGVSIYVFWNLSTLLGGLGAKALGDPRTLGLDAAIPAAFLALLWPRLKGREPWAIAVLSATVAILLTPVLQPGLPVLAAALVAIIAGMRAADVLAPLASAPIDPEEGARDEDGCDASLPFCPWHRSPPWWRCKHSAPGRYWSSMPASQGLPQQPSHWFCEHPSSSW